MKQLTKLALFACALTLSSCSSRQELDDSSKTDNEGASIVFNLSLSDPKISVTRADLPDWSRRLAIDLIENVRIVFYTENNDGKPSKVAYAFDKEVLGWNHKWSGRDLVESPKAGSSTFSITGVKNIAPDDYSVIFFTTPSDELKELTTVGKDYNEIKRPISIKLRRFDDCNYYTPRYSLSTNIETPLHLSKEQLLASVGKKPLQTGNIKLKAMDAIVQFRLVLSEETQDAAGLSVKGIVRFYPDVLNKTVVFFPEMDTNQSGNLTIPKDDNYSGMASWTDEDYKNAFVYNDEIVNASTFGRILSDGYKDKTVRSIVIPENTTSPSELNTKNVTRVIVYAQVLPTELTGLPEFTSKESDKTWFRHEGKNYLWSKFVSDYNQAVAKYSREGKVNNKLTAVENGILRTGLEINKQAFKKEQAKIGDPLAGTTFTSGLHGEDLDIYRDGFSYYALPIRHYSDDEAKSLDAIGRYAVVRNTRYIMDIKAFSKVGCPTYEDLPSDINFTAADIPGFNLSIDDRDVVTTEVYF